MAWTDNLCLNLIKKWGYDVWKSYCIPQNKSLDYWGSTKCGYHVNGLERLIFHWSAKWREVHTVDSAKGGHHEPILCQTPNIALNLKQILNPNKAANPKFVPNPNFKSNPQIEPNPKLKPNPKENAKPQMHIKPQYTPANPNFGPNPIYEPNPNCEPNPKLDQNHKLVSNFTVAPKPWVDGTRRSMVITRSPRAARLAHVYGACFAELLSHFEPDWEFEEPHLILVTRGNSKSLQKVL